MPLDTPLTRLLDVKLPIVAAPMAGASGGLLAAEVSAAGAFGFLAAGYTGPQALIDQLSLARTTLGLAPQDPLPIGVGYLCWQLEQLAEQQQQQPEALLAAALDNRVRAIWFAFGSDIERWIRFVRDYDAAHHDRARKTTVFVQVASVEQARVAVHEWNVDVLVAQGHESGGHGYGAAPPLFSLVSDILAVPTENGPSPPLLAAGGIANGRQIAALLVLGAAGVVLGTRFLVTPESLYSDAQKRALVAAKSDMTVRTMAFDRARGTMQWPPGVDGRGLYNSTVRDMESGQVDVEIVLEKFRQGVRSGDPDRMLVWSGMGVGLISEIKPAREVVQELHNDTLQQLKFSSVLAR